MMRFVKSVASMADTIVILLAAVILVVGCVAVAPAGPEPVSPPPTPPRERALGEQSDYSVDMITGTVTSLAEVYAIQAMDNDAECDTNPLVFDLRSDGHNSFSVLPKMATGDWDALTNPTGSFPGFNLEILDVQGCRAAQPGELYWDLYGVNFECGANNVHPITMDENGDRAAGILLLLSYPGAPALDAAFDPQYCGNQSCKAPGQPGVAPGVYSWTSENGDVAWAYGPESHIDAAGRGPYSSWANRDPEGWTDPVKYSDGLGWIGWWDDHCEPSPILKRTRKAGVGSLGDGYMMIYVDEYGQETGYIPFQTELPPVDVRLLILRSPEGVDLGHVPWEQE